MTIEQVRIMCESTKSLLKYYIFPYLPAKLLGEILTTLL